MEDDEGQEGPAIPRRKSKRSQNDTAAEDDVAGGSKLTGRKRRKVAEVQNDIGPSLSKPLGRRGQLEASGSGERYRLRPRREAVVYKY